MSENEKLKIINITDLFKTDSFIDELKGYDNDSYCVIIVQSNINYPPLLFKGYDELEIEGSIHKYIDGVWESKEFENSLRFDNKKMFTLTAREKKLDESYFKTSNYVYSLFEGDLLVLGNKEDIEACYKRQCEKFEKNKQDSKR